MRRRRGTPEPLPPAACAHPHDHMDPRPARVWVCDRCDVTRGVAVIEQPRYGFSTCGVDYAAMDDETKEMFHQLVNAAGDRAMKEKKMTIRAKFTVQEKTAFAWSKDSVRIKLAPQYDTTIPEDQRFAKATPSGEFWMQVDNPTAAAALELGKSYYIDLTPVEG